MTSAIDTACASQTWREIHAQPVIWADWAARLPVQNLRSWITQQAPQEVWFCGAGTSAYIGDILAAGLPLCGPIRFRSVPSTDLVARPHHYLAGRRDTLIVNFGRSGDSAETLGTLQAVSALCPDMPMLNITCNSSSALAQASSGHAVILPEACHDTGFAMTSSFTTMLLTALAVFDTACNGPEKMTRLAGAAEEALSQSAEHIQAGPTPKRVVFVGGGPMTYVARESALKVMELSAGQIPALWDSSLGFRHGPKSFVTDDTIIHVILSTDPVARAYDLDLVAELRHQFPNAKTMTIGRDADFEIDTLGVDVWDCALSVLPAQLAAVLWSARLGMNIDDPFVGKSTLSRVVSGVRLHPVEVGEWQ